MINSFLLVIITVLLSAIFQTGIDTEKDPKTKGTLSDTVIANQYFRKADLLAKSAKFDSAIHFFLEAGNIFKSMQLWEMYAKCLNGISEQYLFKMDNEKTKEYCHLSLKICLVHSLIHERGNSYNTLGALYFNNGYLDSARIYFNKALRTWLNDEKINYLSIAVLYTNTSILNTETGYFEEALIEAKKAIEILDTLQGNHDEYLAYNFNGIGNIFYKKGDYQRAIANYKKADSLCKRIYPTDHPIFSSINNNIGESLRALGDFSQALIYLKNTIVTVTSSNEKKYPNMASFYHNIGMIYTEMKQFTEALSSYNAAIKIWSEMNGQEINLSITYNNIGHIYEILNKNDSAENYFNKSINLLKNKYPIHPDLASCYSNLGGIYSKSGNNNAALSYYKKALHICELNFGSKHPRIAIININIAKEYSKIGDIQMALPYIQNSIIANVINFNVKNPMENPLLDSVFLNSVLVRSLMIKANLMYELYYQTHDSIKYMKSAFKTNDLAVQLMDIIRAGFNFEESKFILDRENIEVYHQGILFAYLLYKKSGGDYQYLNKAFEYSEKSKYSVLFSSMKELEARNVSGIPETLQTLAKTLRLDIPFYEKIISEEKAKSKPDQNKIGRWHNILFQRNKSYDSLIDLFELKYPDYYQLKYNIKRADISEIQSSLNKNDVLVEYSLSHDWLYTFFITRYTCTLTRNAIDSSFYASICQFRELILKKDYSKASVSTYASVAGFLYSKLLQNGAPLLKNKNLIIIPDGKLGTIPFEALITEIPTEDSLTFKTLPYLVYKNPLGYGYSATIYKNSMEIKKQSYETTVLSIAPTFSPSDPELIKELQTRDDNLINLVGAKEEVRAINKLFKGKILLDSAATKSNFVKYAPDYQIIHISTHGIMNDKIPMESKLAFCREKQNPNYNYLYVYEIFGLVFKKTELAVLSACNTGYGQLQEGEGILSLSRGFLYSGIPSVVSTLWSVNDFSTSKMMILFYKYLDENEIKTVALQKAQVAYLTSCDNITSHPYFWAGFIQIGNYNPLSTFPYWMVLFLIITILIISTGFYWVLNSSH